MATELSAIARTQDVPVSEVVREAVENHIASRFADKDFQQRLKKHLEEEVEILERLSKQKEGRGSRPSPPETSASAGD